MPAPLVCQSLTHCVSWANHLPFLGCIASSTPPPLTRHDWSPWDLLIDAWGLTICLRGKKLSLGLSARLLWEPGRISWGTPPHPGLNCQVYLLEWVCQGSPPYDPIIPCLLLSPAFRFCFLHRERDRAGPLHLSPRAPSKVKTYTPMMVPCNQSLCA